MSIADSIRAPFLSSMRRRLSGARRAVEESVLRPPVSTAFCCYLAKNFGPASVDVEALLASDLDTGKAKRARTTPAHLQIGDYSKDFSVAKIAVIMQGGNDLPEFGLRVTLDAKRIVNGMRLHGFL